MKFCSNPYFYFTVLALTQINSKFGKTVFNYNYSSNTDYKTIW